MLGLVVIVLYSLLPNVLLLHFRMRFLALIVITLGLELVGFALLGIPGAAFLEPLEPIMIGLGRPAIPADGAWSAAIIVTFLLPLGFLLSSWIARVFFQTQSFWSKLGLASLVFLLISVLLSSVTYLVIF